jgi:hypothetical protein
MEVILQSAFWLDNTFVDLKLFFSFFAFVKARIASRTTMSCDNRIAFVPSLPAQEGLGMGPISLLEKVLPP